MTFCGGLRKMYSSLQDRITSRRRKSKRHLEISEPFDFKKETISFPGISQYDINLLREKAVASQVGVADKSYINSTMNPLRLHRAASMDYINPRLPPPIPERSPSQPAMLLTSRSVTGLPLPPVSNLDMTVELERLPPISPTSTIETTLTPGADLTELYTGSGSISPLSPRVSPQFSKLRIGFP
ncbi:hypothetical protein B0T17DRAFT_299220 [Bombardia bombarda]|uniref:Uncharacterized protein n=1 Tax=Bombardia bombarda TaxID=252184 RepID=A0AA39WU45_9PEZI|nr:hypothetical protein B0T17DRAFT_299220 [Bombardia bombarda]